MVYRIDERVTESLECFFVRRKLDLKRRTDLKDTRVTVFRPFEKDGQRMLGSSGVNIHPGMGREEIERQMCFSKERYRADNYEGPFAVRIEGVKVAGE